MARYAEDAKDRATCPQCKGPLEDCEDQEKVWYPQLSTCFKIMSLARYQERWDSLHKALPYHDGTFTQWGKERTLETRYHYTEGTRVFVADQDFGLGGDFLSPSGLQDQVDEESSDG